MSLISSGKRLLTEGCVAGCREEEMISHIEMHCRHSAHTYQIGSHMSTLFLCFEFIISLSFILLFKHLILLYQTDFLTQELSYLYMRLLSCRILHSNNGRR